jgi:hypothetical protein
MSLRCAAGPSVLATSHAHANPCAGANLPPPPPPASTACALHMQLATFYILIPPLHQFGPSCTHESGPRSGEIPARGPVLAPWPSRTATTPDTAARLADVRFRRTASADPLPRRYKSRSGPRADVSLIGRSHFLHSPQCSSLVRSLPSLLLPPMPPPRTRGSGSRAPPRS